MWWGALIVLLAGVLYLEGIPGGLMSPPQASAGEDSGGPPPLEVDEDAPRLEDMTPEEEKAARQTAESGADNFACYVCHANYDGEPLAETHKQAGVGCIRCHGESQAHRLDEENITPPDRMFPAEDIKPFCTQCHLTHDAPAQDVIARWQKRCPGKTDPASVTCTDCHGDHRLDVRSVRWDKETGELLPLKDDSDTQGDQARGRRQSLPIFAFIPSERNTSERALQKQAQLLKEMGYDGAAHLGLDGVAERLKTLEHRNLDLFLLGIRAQAPTQGLPFATRLEEVLALLKGRPTIVVPVFDSSPPDGPHGRRGVLDTVRQIADKAASHNLRVALYPRKGGWPTNMKQALQAVRELDRENTGLVLNLSDCEQLQKEANARALLSSAMPHLFAVTVEFADLKAAATLSGLLSLVDRLQELGYRGPLGIRAGSPGGAKVASDHP